MLALWCAWALAHEGHDHGPPPAPAVAAHPRAVAEGDLFELVAVLEEDHLRIHLDRADSNEPVADARIEVETGGVTQLAEALGPGLYRVAAGAAAAPGRHVLVFTLVVGEADDLLIADLDVPGDVGAGPPRSWPVTLVWGGGAAMLLAGLIWVVQRRRGRVGVSRR